MSNKLYIEAQWMQKVNQAFKSLKKEDWPLIREVLQREAPYADFVRVCQAVLANVTVTNLRPSHFVDQARGLRRGQSAQQAHDSFWDEPYIVVNNSDEIKFTGTGAECNKYITENGPGLYPKSLKEAEMDKRTYTEKDLSNINAGLLRVYGERKLREHGIDPYDNSKALENSDKTYWLWFDKKLRMGHQLDDALANAADPWGLE